MDNQSTPKAEAKQDGQRFYHAQTGWQLILSLSADEMECLAHLDIKPEGSLPGIDEIKGLLAGDGICVGIENAGLERLLSEARPGKSATGLVARGLPAQTGDNGQLVYSIETEAGSTANTTTTDQDSAEQQIDFRNVQQFINVEPDQEIGRISPPTSGTPGRTVRNKPVPAEPGKSLQLKLGQNVRAGGENGEQLFAELHGRVKLEGDTIQVVEEYVVDGDVDFSIGNIRFNGFVEIRGDVLDGFQVSASKGLKITGNVGACRLISHGSIEFCGMDAQGKGSILCGGNLHAQFIHDCSVECWGTLQVAVELRNCTIHSRSAIITGQLAGGEYVALSGIEAKRLGAPSAIKTHLHSGIDYHDLDRMQVLLKQLEELQEKIGRTKELTALNQLGTEKQRLMAAIVEVRNRRPAGSNAKINVKDRIHEGVTICLGSAVEEFSHAEEGPVSLIENSREGGLRRLSLSSLEVAAKDLEQAWLARQEQERQQQEAAAQEQQTKEDLAEEQPEG
jgi:hypothetical protein